MAVKFSDFTQKQLVTEVTNMVGYLATGEINIMIPPGNLDTTYVVSTGNAGASPTINLQGTKPNQPSITPSTVSLTGSGATLLAGNGTTTIDFASTAYALAVGVNADPAVNTPVTLTGLDGNNAHTDTVNLIGTGTVQITSTGGVITIDGGSAGDVTSLNQVAGATSTGQALTVAGTGTGPFTGAVTVASNIYGGTTNIGIVPSGGSSTTFLQGDGNWATPPSGTDTTYTVDVPTGTTSINLKGSDATDDAIVLVGGTDIGLVRDSANQITINSQAVGGVTSVDETTPGTSSGTPIVVNPTTGTVLVQSMAYAGQGNVGHVPAGGVAGQYLDGDIGAWITLPSTLSIDKQTFTGNGTLTDFTLTTAAGCTADNLNIYISGVYQNSVDASNAVNYTVTSGLNPTLQFVSAGTPTAPPVTATRGIEVVITR